MLICRSLTRFPFRNRFEPTLRVYKWAERINSVEKGNEEVVMISAIFHDVGKSINGDTNHAEESAKICRDYLLDQGFDLDFVERVTNVIRVHSSKEMPAEDLSLEERILIDADTLDETGALTVLWDSVDTGAKKEQSYLIVYNRVAEALEHKKGDLKRLKTDEGRRLYHERNEFLESCIRNLEYELGMQ